MYRLSIYIILPSVGTYTVSVHQYRPFKNLRFSVIIWNLLYEVCTDQFDGCRESFSMYINIPSNNIESV